MLKAKNKKSRYNSERLHLFQSQNFKNSTHFQFHHFSLHSLSLSFPRTSVSSSSPLSLSKKSIILHQNLATEVFSNNKMAPTPSSTSKIQQTFRTPLSKHRLNFTSSRTPNPNQPCKETQQIEHPIEVIGRMRDYSEEKEKPTSILQVNPDNRTLRVRTDIGYRDFSLDGISFSEQEDLDAFYKKFVESRINGVKLGAKCTIMMYGPTGSGKSHTMFGSAKQAGIVYRSLKDILGEGESESEGSATFVQVTVLEIYNEEIYDLLSSGGVGFGIGWPKGGCASKVKLEVMGKKAKNASFISGTEAGKIAKEIQKVEKRRIVKSTLCNDRSSRSHCMIILDVPTVGGRLMLVDMAGSENIDQAGQVGFEAKMQTAKINQGNIALKRVVESIANGDSHVPFRDSKLTMLLQDSFEDDKSKILMILCASPDPKEIHKTICTLEYGAKAKCIVRGPRTPLKDKGEDSSAVILGSRIAAMDQFIYKLQEENKLREKERNEAHKQLMKKEEEIAALRTLIEGKGPAASQEEINLMLNERTNMLKTELERKLEECRRMAEEFVEMERRRMEERILQQQQEVELLRRRLEEIEFEVSRSKDDATNENGSGDMDGSNFARRLMGVYADEEPGMVKSMDLDMEDQDVIICVDTGANNRIQNFSANPDFCDKVCLSTVYEEEEEEEDQKERVESETEKEVEEIKKVVDVSTPRIDPLRDVSDVVNLLSGPANEFENLKDAAASRRMRIQNIFTLCGNNRQLSQHLSTTLTPAKKSEHIDSIDSVLKSLNKENTPPVLKNAAMIDTGKDLSYLIEAPHLSSTPFITRRRR